MQAHQQATQFRQQSGNLAQVQGQNQQAQSAIGLGGTVLNISGSQPILLTSQVQQNAAQMGTNRQVQQNNQGFRQT